MRLMNNMPNNSVILIDEPELHLNPRLVKELPSFYDNYIGAAHNNQMWLLTHSDALLRQSVNGRNRYTSLRMMPSPCEKDNQLQIIGDASDCEKAVIDLVGDISNYIPGAKLVVLEGAGETKLDKFIIEVLFPSFAMQVNFAFWGLRNLEFEMHIDY